MKVVIALCVCLCHGLLLLFVYACVIDLYRFNCQLHCQQLFRQWLFSTVTICC